MVGISIAQGGTGLPPNGTPPNGAPPNGAPMAQPGGYAPRPLEFKLSRLLHCLLQSAFEVSVELGLLAGEHAQPQLQVELLALLAHVAPDGMRSVRWAGPVGEAMAARGAKELLRALQGHAQRLPTIFLLHICELAGRLEQPHETDAPTSADTNSSASAGPVVINPLLKALPPRNAAVALRRAETADVEEAETADLEEAGRQNLSQEQLLALLAEVEALRAGQAEHERQRGQREAHAASSRMEVASAKSEAQEHQARRNKAEAAAKRHRAELEALKRANAKLEADLRAAKREAAK
eukprot:SAG11_NODE_8943_length_960_cov_1.312427_1_plen_294_part_10